MIYMYLLVIIILAILFLLSCGTAVFCLVKKKAFHFSLISVLIGILILFILRFVMSSLTDYIESMILY